MRFLGGINEERPTENPSVIPNSATLCSEDDGGARSTGNMDGGTQ